MLRFRWGSDNSREQPRLCTEYWNFNSKKPQNIKARKGVILFRGLKVERTMKCVYAKLHTGPLEY